MPLSQEEFQSRCIMFPSFRTSRFFDRPDVVQKMNERLDGTDPDLAFGSLAIHGLRGVGKSTTALRYAETKLQRGELDLLFWVHAEKPFSLSSSFNVIARRLELPKVKFGIFDDNRALVLDWLQNTGARNMT